MLEMSQLQTFVDDCGDRAYRFAYGLCGNESDARELVQEALVKIIDKADQYDDTLSLESWFLTVMKNLFMDHMRHWERRRGISLDVSIGEGLTLSDAMPDTREVSLLDRLQREENVSQVRCALLSLTIDAREVLTLVDINGMSYDQAALIIGCPAGTIRSRLSRARGTLKARLLSMEVAT
jgi:RNA polymerase sigma-70 factor (ECF subfamily)